MEDGCPRAKASALCEFLPATVLHLVDVCKQGETFVHAFARLNAPLLGGGVFNHRSMRLDVKRMLYLFKHHGKAQHEAEGLRPGRLRNAARVPRQDCLELPQKVVIEFCANPAEMTLELLIGQTRRDVLDSL